MKDREPEVLWMEVHDVVQEAVIKTIPTKKKCKKAKWLPEEALKIAEKRREAKGKGEKERYTHLNVELQSIARRDEKASQREQYREIDEKQWDGKDYTSLQENQRYQGNISCKDGHSKGQKWYGPNRSKGD